MRGKQLRIYEVIAPHRNIPAYAGKTLGRFSWFPQGWEHPRVCGENTEILSPQNANPGTSPRMRGKLDPPEIGYDGSRNIPAYAGKTRLARAREDAAAEHPRVCGENLMK